MVKVVQYNDGTVDVSIERHGYHRTHRNVKPSSIIRLAQACKGCAKQVTHNVTHMVIEIKLHSR